MVPTAFNLDSYVASGTRTLEGLFPSNIRVEVEGLISADMVTWPSTLTHTLLPELKPLKGFLQSNVHVKVEGLEGRQVS